MITIIILTPIHTAWISRPELHPLPDGFGDLLDLAQGAVSSGEAPVMIVQEPPELGDLGLAVESRPLVADRLAVPDDRRPEIALRFQGHREVVQRRTQSAPVFRSESRAWIQALRT